VSIKLKLKPISGTHQVHLEHTVSYRKSTLNGESSEKATQTTTLHVGKFGKLTITPENQLSFLDKQGNPTTPELGEPHTMFTEEAIKALQLGAAIQQAARAVLDCTSSGDGEGPRLYLSADEHTLNVDENQPRDAATVVEFCELRGWHVFCAEGPGRYTLTVTLLAPDAERGGGA
jgi:hypothetical protein